MRNVLNIIILSISLCPVAFVQEKTISTNVTVTSETKKVAELNNVSTNISSAHTTLLEEGLKESSNRFAFIAKTFPKNFDAEFGAKLVDVEFMVSYDSLADIEYREKHKEFVRKHSRLIKHEIVSKGDLHGEVVLTDKEISWWKQNLMNQRIKNKKFIDYKGNSYIILNISGAKITSSASLFGGNESKNLESTPELAYKSVIFSLKLNKAVDMDERFSFFKKEPLWLVDKEVQIIKYDKLPERITDNKKLAAIKNAVVKAWPTAKIDDFLSFYLLQSDKNSKLYSVSMEFDRCKDGLDSWSKCNKANEIKPWWVYLGIDETSNFKLIDLGGHLSVGFTHDKNPKYKFHLLGDINRNGYLEFLYYSDNQLEGNNVATIYEIHKGEALSVWNWTDFQE